MGILYHLTRVASSTEQQIEAKGWPFTCTFNDSKAKNKIKWVTIQTKSTRSIKQVIKCVTKWLTIFRLSFNSIMAKQKVSNKDQYDKVVKTLAEHKAASSHKGQKN